MNYLDGKKCLDEILEAVTDEDEEKTFLSLEYDDSNYNGIVIGPTHSDGYGNWSNLFGCINHDSIDGIFDWDSYEEGVAKVCADGGCKCMHLRDGIKIAFDHCMVIYPVCKFNDSYPKPLWLDKYDEWTLRKNLYKESLLPKEEQNKEFIESWEEELSELLLRRQ